MKNNWIKIEKGVDPFEGLDIDKVEVLFDTGETCMYNEDWPFAIATHIREI